MSHGPHALLALLVTMAYAPSALTTEPAPPEPAPAEAADSPPQVEASEEEEAEAIGERPPLPKTLEARPALPPLVMYRPAPRADEGHPGRWTASLGGGIAIPLPDSDHLYAPGPAVLIEVTCRLWGELSLWTQATISLMSFQEDVVIEPGYGRGLTAASGVVGVAYSIPVLDWIDAHVAAGVGVGGFGVHGPGEAIGLAFDSSAGFRLRFDGHLAVRVDLVPTLLVPTDGAGVGGHLSATVRGELRF